MNEDFTDASIMIVDDEPPNVAVLERLLHHSGYGNTRSTTDPREVPEFFAEEVPDLLLLALRNGYLRNRPAHELSP